ncbi:MAG: hypothetical protein WAP35_10280 [Solirubrobacterales bacterium]
MFSSVKTLTATRIALATAFCLLLICLLLISGSAFASGDDVVADCTDNGSIDRKYSSGELKSALSGLRTDVEEYTDCRSLIEQALLESMKKRNKGSGDSKDDNSATLASLTTPAQRKKAQREVEESTKLSESGPIGGVIGAEVERQGSTLQSNSAPGVPTALIIALVGMALLFTGDLAGRIAKMPGMKKFSPKTGPLSGRPD